MINISFNQDPDFVTNDATPVTAYTITVPEGNTCEVDLRVFARGLTDGASAMWGIAGLGKRVGAGNLTAVGTPISIFPAKKDAAALAWDAAFSLSGSNIVLTLTGSGTQRVGWTFDFKAIGFSNANVA